MKLYDFQAEQLEQVRLAFQKHRSVIMQLPTGGGKTVIAGAIAQKLAARKSNVLVLVHRTELLDQFYSTLIEVGLDRDVSFIAAGRTHMSWSRFQIASIATAVRRDTDDKFHFKPDFIFVDEAHHCRAKSWAQLLNKFPRAKILGLTATPMRLDGKGLGAHFDTIVEGKSMRWLIDNGYLAPFEYKVPASHLSMAGVKIQMGDWNKSQMYEHVDDDVVADASKAYVRYANGRSALFFGIVREHSKRVARSLVNMGISAEHVDGDTPLIQRRLAFSRFKRGDLKVICNVDIATEGVDIPGCDVVMLGRPTKSLTIYLQQIGRVLRYQPNKVAMILDLVGNIFTGEFGMPDMQRHWSLEDNVVKMNSAEWLKEQRDLWMTCKKCHTVHKKSQAKCPSCGYVRQRVSAPAELPKEADMELVSIDDMNFKIPKTKTGYNRKAVFRACGKLGGDEDRIRKLAAHLGYNEGWVKYAVSYINKTKAKRTQ